MASKGRYWTSLLVSAVIAVAIYHGGMLAAFFTALVVRSPYLQMPLYFFFLLLPLQVVFLRRGAEDFVKVAALAFLILLLFRVVVAAAVLNELETALVASERELERVVLAPLPGILVPLVFIELATAAVLIGGLVWLNVYSPIYVHWRSTYRLLAATIAAGATGVVVVFLLTSNGRFVAGLEELFVNMLAAFKNAIDETGQGAAWPSEINGSELTMRVFWDYVVSGFIFGYFVNLTAAWHFGQQWGVRRLRRQVPQLVKYRVPDSFVWPLIVSWGLVVVSRYVSLGLVRSAALSTGLLFLLLFGLQGVGVIQHLIAKSPRLREMRRFRFMAILMLVFFVPVRQVALVLIPLVGVSEIWIQYRVERRGEENEGDT